MNDSIIKPGVINRIVERLKDTKIVVGGNKITYKSKYHLKYSQEIVNNVLDAFLDTVRDAIAEGDTIQINGYITIKPSYVKERMRVNPYTNEKFIAPAHYQTKIYLGTKLQEANERYNKKVNSQDE